MSLKTVTLMLTQWCNLSCAHCGYASNPRRARTAINPDLARLVIDEAARRGARLVAFTGGEPFAFQELLVDLVQHANSRGLPSEVATNCFWARGPAAARAALAPLVASGLRQLVVSYDEFHNGFFARPVVRHAIHAALAERIKVQVRVTRLRSTSLGRDRVIRELDLAEAMVAGSEPQVHIVEKSVLAVGEARSRIPRSERARAVPARSLATGCDSAISSIAIDSDGRLYPCCGFAAVAGATAFGFDTIERADASLVRGAFDRMENNLLMNLINAVGPTRVLALAGAAGSDARYASSCDACLRIGCDARAGAAVSSWLGAIVGGVPTEACP